MKVVWAVFLFIVGASIFAFAPMSRADVLFYGGDFDGRNGFPSSYTPDFHGLIFDDFGLSSAANLQSIWGNFALVQSVEYYIPTQAYCEIRSGMSAGNGGTLWFSGVLPVQAAPTGRIGFGLQEYQVLANLNLTLSAGTYWLGMALDSSSIFAYGGISTTSGGNVGPESDPNPPPTGFPPADGMSYFYYPPDYNFVPTELTTLGPGQWDFSYGVSGVVVPEPSTCAMLLLGAAALLMSRWRKRGGEASLPYPARAPTESNTWNN